MDYKALNAIIMKDGFPIPTIDELFDRVKWCNLFLKA